MSFNPPPNPGADTTYQYGNIIWRFDGTAGVWNIVDGSLVGERGPEGPPGPQGNPGIQGDPGDPSVGDGGAMIVSDGVITARLGGFGITGVMGVTGRFGVSNGIVSLLPASQGASGIASFDSSDFIVSSTGHVTLIGDFGGATGDTVLGGIAISTVRGQGTNAVTINNIGVTSFNGLTGAIRYAPPLATTGASGVASFSSINFAVSTTGHVSLKPIRVPDLADFDSDSLNDGDGSVMVYDTNVQDPLQPFFLAPVTNVYSPRVATASLTGVARFPATHFAVSNGAVSLSGPFGIIGVTGIAVGDNDVGLTGRVQITAGTNVTITTESGNRIRIASSGGGGSSITASPQQVLFSSGNGGTGSNNFVFNGLAATFGGANTQFAITSPTFNIGNNTVVSGGIFYDAAESAPYFSVPSGNFEIRGASGSVQRIRTNQSEGYVVSLADPNDGWTEVDGVSESVVVIMQSESGKTGIFDTNILTTVPRPIIGGVTGGIDVFTVMLIKHGKGTDDVIRMAFPIARGMTAPNFTIGN